MTRIHRPDQLRDRIESDLRELADLTSPEETLDYVESIARRMAEELGES
jgi:hypothetical protein